MTREQGWEGDLIFTEYLFVPFEFCVVYMLPNQKINNLFLRVQWSPNYCFVSCIVSCLCNTYFLTQALDSAEARLSTLEEVMAAGSYVVARTRRVS